MLSLSTAVAGWRRTHFMFQTRYWMSHLASRVHADVRVRCRGLDLLPPASATPSAILTPACSQLPLLQHLHIRQVCIIYPIGPPLFECLASHQGEVLMSFNKIPGVRQVCCICCACAQLYSGVWHAPLGIIVGCEQCIDVQTCVCVRLHTSVCLDRGQAILVQLCALSGHF